MTEPFRDTPTDQSPPPPSDEPSVESAPVAAPVKQTERPHPLTPLIRGWIVLLAVAWGFLHNLIPDGSPDQQVPGGDGPPWWVFGAGIAVVVLLSALAGFASWYFTHFVIDDDELRIETGWLNKTSKRIAFTRIQAVDVVQPLAARIFGLSELAIDAGGGENGSARLRYLKRDRAYQLRDYLLARAHGRQVTVAESALQPTAGAFDDLSVADRVIVRISPDKIILAGLMSLELWIPGVLLLAYFIVTVVTDLPVWSGAFALLPLIFGAIGFLSKRVITQFNYTLAETHSGLRITRGLTNLVSQSVPIQRVQGVSITQPITWRMLGLYRMHVDILGSGGSAGEGEDREQIGLLMPAGTAEQVALALNHIWPGLDLSRVTWRPASPRAKWLRPIGWRYLRYGLDDRVVISEAGWTEHSRTIVPHARTQSVALKQGPLQRALGVASVEVHSTPGPVDLTALHLSEDEARALAVSQLDRLRASTAAALTTAPVVDAPRARERVWPVEDEFAPDWRDTGQV